MGKHWQLNLLSTTCGLITMAFAIGFGSSILDKSIRAIDGPEFVWVWCLIYIIICAILAAKSLLLLCFNAKDNESMNKPLDIIFGLIALAHFIWGIVIYAKLDHNHAYYDNYPKLWILFLVFFWYNVAIYIVVIIIITCACCVICFTGRTLKPPPRLHQLYRPTPHAAASQSPVDEVTSLDRAISNISQIVGPSYTPQGYNPGPSSGHTDPAMPV